MGFGMRFRFRVGCRLNVSSPEMNFSLDGRELRLESRGNTAPIDSSDWLVVTGRDFETESAARDFGQKVAASAELASVAVRLGIDPGCGQSTLSFSSEVRDRLRAECGSELSNDVHGVSVFKQDRLADCFAVTGSGTVTVPAAPFVDGLVSFFDAASTMSEGARSLVVLMNYALMRPDPVARAVFSISAVESVAKTRTQISNSENELIQSLARAARMSTIGTPGERDRVANRLCGLSRISIRQSVKILLDDLGLGGLRGKWESLYKERSRLVHGLAPMPGVDYGPLADKAVSLCGRILMECLAAELPGVAISAERYPLV